MSVNVSKLLALLDIALCKTLLIELLQRDYLLLLRPLTQSVKVIVAL